MRIVLVSSEYPPADDLGGIGTNTATVAPALARRGHDVCVVTTGDPGTTEHRGVTVVRPRHRWLPNRPLDLMAQRRRIAAAAEAFRPDVIHAAEWEAEAWWLARFGSVPVVTRLATPTYLVEDMNRGRLDARARLVRALERDQTRRSAAVFAPTRAIADRVEADWALGDEAVRLIPNPFELAQVREFGRSQPPFQLPERFIAFIGRMERRKGIEELATALPAVLGANPGLEAVFIGRDPGDEEGALMDRFRAHVAPVADRVHVVGSLPRRDALSIVARAEVVALPSLWESFGYVAAEAMALARPVVATRTGGFPEFIEDGVTGWLVEPGNPAALEASILERLADPEGARAVSERAAGSVEHLDVEHVVDELVALYEDATESRRGFGPGLYRRGYRRYFRADDPADPFHTLYERKREAVLAGLGDGERRRIVDVGGGYGRVASRLAAGNDVTLVDISPEMIEEARQVCPPDVELVVADARQLPFEAESYDAAVALDLAPHVDDLAGTLRELARVVRPGGRVVFDTTNALPLWVLAYPRYVTARPKRVLLTLAAGGVLPEWRQLVRHHRERAARDAIASAGLTIERLEPFGPGPLTKWHLWWTRKG